MSEEEIQWQGGMKVINDAVEVAVSRELTRLGKLNGLTEEQTLKSEELHGEALTTVKRRLISILEWRP